MSKLSEQQCLNCDNYSGIYWFCTNKCKIEFDAWRTKMGIPINDNNKKDINMECEKCKKYHGYEVDDEGVPYPRDCDER